MRMLPISIQNSIISVHMGSYYGITQLPIRSEISFVGIANNGSYVAAATSDASNKGIIYYFNGNGTLLWQHDTFGDNKPVVMSSDGSQLLVGEDYGSLLFDSNGDLLLNDTQYPAAEISQNGSFMLLSNFAFLSNYSDVQLISLSRKFFWYPNCRSLGDRQHFRVDCAEYDSRNSNSIWVQDG